MKLSVKTSITKSGEDSNSPFGACLFGRQGRKGEEKSIILTRTQGLPNPFKSYAIQSLI